MQDAFATRLLRSLQELVSGEGSVATFAEVQQGLCDQAVEFIDGCDHASLTVMTGPGVRTLAASSPTARDVDDLQVRLRQGPHVDADDTDEPDQYLVPDLRHGSPWPDLAEAMLAQTPVLGAAGFRLRDRDRTVGALNLLSDTPDALSETSLEQATIFAALATMSLSTADSERRASTMRAGLDSNRVIGTAVGLVMASHRLDADEAFAVLARLSQEMNVKLVKVATDVVAGHDPHRL